MMSMLVLHLSRQRSPLNPAALSRELRPEKELKTLARAILPTLQQ